MTGLRKRKLQATFTVATDAKEMTADIFCRTFFEKSEAAFINELKLYGMDRLSEATLKAHQSQPCVQPPSSDCSYFQNVP
jgi:hypothetical protein